MQEDNHADQHQNTAATSCGGSACDEDFSDHAAVERQRMAGDDHVRTGSKAQSVGEPEGLETIQPKRNYGDPATSPDPHHLQQKRSPFV